MRHIAFLFLPLMFAVSTGVSAQNAGLDQQDTRFLEEAALSGTFEMQANQMALQSARQDRVKEFARLMLVEHEIIDADLKRLASDHEVTLPVTLDGDRQAVLSELQQLTGSEFDKKYVDQVAVGEHQKAVALFNEAAEQTEHDDVRAFAASTGKVLQQHLDQAKKMTDMHGAAE